MSDRTQVNGVERETKPQGAVCMLIARTLYCHPERHVFLFIVSRNDLRSYLHVNENVPSSFSRRDSNVCI